MNNCLFEPENDLEIILMKASGDTSYKVEFYRTLLESDILALINEKATEEEKMFIATENTPIQYIGKQINGKKCLPIFSSLTRLNNYIGEKKTAYIRINARDFFESIDPALTVMLNLNSAYGKEFTSAEVKRILDGTIFK